jgi:hypothetical protein
MVSRQGKRATTMNFYGMSPPVPIDGYLISGFIPWRHLRSATYPESLFEMIKAKPGFDYKQLGMDIGEEKKCIQGIEDGEFEPWIQLQSERDAAWTELLAHLMGTDPISCNICSGVIWTQIYTIRIRVSGMRIFGRCV